MKLTGDEAVMYGPWHGGEGVFEVGGNLGTGTLTLERSLDGGETWAELGEHTTATAVGGVFAASRQALLRVKPDGLAENEAEYFIEKLCKL